MSNADYADRLLAAAQARCPAPVEAAAVLTRPGAIGNVAVGQLSPLAAMLRNRSAKKRAAGLPQNVVAALTATAVEVFAFKPSGRGVKLGDQVASWPRAGLRVVADEPGALSQRLHLTLADGTTLDLDSARGMGSARDLNAPFLAALVAPAPTTF